MQDVFFKMIFFSLMFAVELGIVYFYAHKTYPKLALRVIAIVFILLMLISFYSAATSSLLSLIAMVVLLLVFKKPDQTAAYQKFYADNKIYASTIISPAVMAVVGEKAWVRCEGTMNKSMTDKVNYLFWLGTTSSYVTTGKYSHSTAYTWYLVFIFPPGTVSTVFKQRAMAAADKSSDSFGLRCKHFFVPDTDRPCLVTTAADGSFIIEYIALPDTAYYQKKLDWVKDNIGKLYYPASALTFATN